MKRSLDVIWMQILRFYFVGQMRSNDLCLFKRD